MMRIDSNIASMAARNNTSANRLGSTGQLAGGLNRAGDNQDSVTISGEGRRLAAGGNAESGAASAFNVQDLRNTAMETTLQKREIETVDLKKLVMSRRRADEFSTNYRKDQEDRNFDRSNMGLERRDLPMPGPPKIILGANAGTNGPGDTASNAVMGINRAAMSLRSMQMLGGQGMGAGAKTLDDSSGAIGSSTRNVFGPSLRFGG